MNPMTFTNDAELVAAVATAAVKATLAATGGAGGGIRLTPPKMPTTPKAPVRPSLAPARPVRPTPLTRSTRTASAAPAPVDRERLAVCIHEAGHAVTGVVLGAELSTVVVPPKGMPLAGGLKGQARFFDCPEHVQPLVSYAGPWAQAKFAAGHQRPTMREFNAVLDTAGCHDARALTAAGGIHEGAGAQSILDRCWPAVQTLARKLYRDWEASHLDVCAALGITDGGGYYSSQLASLRSGCRSVPPFTPRTPQPA